MIDNARRTGAALEAHYQFLAWLVPTIENPGRRMGSDRRRWSCLRHPARRTNACSVRLLSKSGVGSLATFVSLAAFPQFGSVHQAHRPSGGFNEYTAWKRSVACWRRGPPKIGLEASLDGWAWCARGNTISTKLIPRRRPRRLCTVRQPAHRLIVQITTIRHAQGLR